MKRLIFILAFIAATVVAMAQTTVVGPGLYDLRSTAYTTLTVDTVVNTATATLTLRVKGVGSSVGVQWVATKISGTVAGTVSLYGSIDGTNYSSISSSTFTATNVASQNFIWQIVGNPVAYYRVTWTGAGTMSASQSAKLLIH